MSSETPIYTILFMKSHFRLLNRISILFVLFILFTFKSFAGEVIIGSGTSYSTSYLPAYYYYGYGWSATVYSKSELQQGGFITKLEYQRVSGSSSVTSQTVFMAEISDSNLVNSGYINPSSVNATQVFSGTVTFTAGFSGITLQTPFQYSGNGHLLVLWENRLGSYGSSFAVYSAYKNPGNYYNCRYAYSSSSFPSTSSGTSSNYRPITKITSTPLYSNNLKLKEWAFPTNGSSGSSTMPISIKVQNTGSQAQSNYTIKYSIDNGASWISQVISASIASQATANLTFTTPANMAAAGVYQCIAVVRNTGDTITSDDTLRQNITICGGQYGGTYIVGNLSGTNFPDIETAITAIKMCGISSNVTLKVLAGNYGQVRIPYINGLSASKTITIETYSGQKDVVFNSSNTSSTYSDNYTIKFDTASFIKLKNLVINTSGTNGAHAIYFNMASNNTIENCEINGDQANNSTYYQFSTIYLGNSNYTNSNQNTFINNSIKYGSYGVFLQGNSSSYSMYGNKFYGNTISDFYYTGIYSNYNDSLTISGNHILSNKSTANYGIYNNYDYNSINIFGNKIEHNYGMGIYNYYVYTTSSYPTKIYNNFIYSTLNTSTVSCIGLYNYNSNYVLTEHNSFYLTNPNGSSQSNYSIYQYYGSGATFRNNSIINEGAGYAFYLSGGTPSYFNYNNLYTNGSYLAYWSGYRTTLAALISAVSSSGLSAANCINTTGVYYSTSNLHSNSSALDGAASNSTFVTTDYDGQTRSSSIPDIGADEFTILPIDGGLISFNQLTNQCAGSVVPIKVTLKNYGTQTITSAYVKASIGNSTIGQAWTGFISPGSQAIVVVGNYTFSSDTVYHITAFVDSINNTKDLNTFNDSLTESNFRTAMSGSYVVGASTSADFPSLTAAVAAIDQFGICGPVVFNMESGVYTGQYNFGSISGVNATNTITIQSLTGNASDVEFNYSGGSSSYDYVFYFNTTSGYKLKNITISNTSSSGYNTGVLINSSSDIEIDGCNINGVANAYMNCVSIQYSDNIIVKNSTLSDNGSGVYSLGSSSDYNFDITVENNTISNYFYYGVYASYTDTLKVINNNISSLSTSSSTQYGIYVYYLDKYMDLSKNKIYLSGPYNQYGIYLNYINYTNQFSTSKLWVQNNFITTNSDNYACYGIYNRYSYYTKLYFNSVNQAGTYTSSYALYAYYAYYKTMLNNIFRSQSGYAFYNYYGSTTSSDYNNYHTGGSYLINYNGYYYNTLSFLSGTESHSKNVLPGYLSTTDLHIFNQLLNDAGSPVAGITKDIDNETRSTYLPDIGADEFSITARDVLPYAVNSPDQTAAIGYNDIKVSIKNLGTNSLYSTYIYYKLDNGSTTSHFWTGALPFLGIDSNIQLGNVYLSSGAHTLKIWTSTFNGQTDLNTSNDTLYYNLTAVPKPLIVVTPNPLTDTIIACNGTATNTFKIKNTGSAALTVTMPAQTASNDTFNILVLTAGADLSYSLPNAKTGILSNLPNSVFTESSTTSTSTLSSLLIGKDVVLIPRHTATVSAFTSFGPILQNFISQGGLVIFLGSQSYASNMFNTGLWNGSYYSYLSSGYYYTINNANHPIWSGVSAYPLSTYYTNLYNIYNTDATTLANYSGYPIMAERTIGLGKTILLGIDFYYTSTDNDRILSNAINYGVNNTNFVSSSAINQTIAAGDSTNITVTFNASGHNNGWNTTNLRLTTNDASNNPYILPCSLYVVGLPDAYASKTFHSFGSIYTGQTVIDSLYIGNSGCNTLNITGVTTNNGALTCTPTSGTVAPGDSLKLKFYFTPTTAGTYTMAATIANNDANLTINFAGSAVSPPTLTVTPSPIVKTLVNCNDSLVVPLTLTNTGGGTLTGSLTGGSGTGTIDVLMLTYGNTTTYYSSLASALSKTFSNYTLTYSNASTASQLQTDLAGIEVVILPYMSSTSYTSTYASFATTIQNFVNNGGTMIFAGQYTSTRWAYITNMGFWTNTSYLGYTNYSALTVNTHPITNTLTSSMFSSESDYFFYFNGTPANYTPLLSYSGYNVAGVSTYGSGHVVYLGFYYYSTTGHDPVEILASNTLKYVYELIPQWMSAPTTTFNYAAGGSGTMNITLKSEDVAAGTYSTNLTFNTNNPVNPTVLVPCTLTIRNEIPGTANLGADTSYCGPKLLNAGSGSGLSYIWNTGNTTQTLNATTSGYYMVTVSDGGVCSSRDTVLLTIKPIPTANFTGLPTSSCTNNTNLTLTGSPTGGSFSGTGMTSNIFSPASAGAGSHQVTYSYTNAQGCSDTEVKTVNVYNPPTVSFTGLNSSYCPQGTGSTLVGSPTGGTFTGPGVTGNTFNPMLTTPGTHNVIYSYTDAFGCSNKDTNSTLVKSYVTANVTGLANHYCINSASTTLTSSIAGTVFSGPGITGNTFNPATAGVGTINIILNYTANSCNFVDTITTTVHALPSGVTLSGLSTDYCVNDGDDNLVGTPIGGTFSGTGVAGNLFDPSLAGVGTHTLTYTYTDGYGCSSYDDFQLTVHALPTITFNNIAPSYCINGGNIQLSATPAGGSFSGNNVSGTTFNVSSAGVGTHKVYYTYVDSYSCEKTDSTNIVINPLPTVNFIGLPDTICSNGVPVTLVGNPTGGTFSGPGVSGNIFNPTTTTPGLKTVTYNYTAATGCSNSIGKTVYVSLSPMVNLGSDQVITYNTSTQFNPTIAGGSGSYSFSWLPSNMVTNATTLNPTTVNLTTPTIFSLTVTDNVSGCHSTDSVSVTLSGGPLGIALNSSASTICSGQTVNLIASGSGGASTSYTYTWTSNPAGFTSSNATVQVSPTVTTTYTCQISDGSSTVSASKTITVNPTPVVSISGLASSYCSNNAVVTLTGTPTGGTFSGSGVIGSNFNPANASLGQITITYQYSNSFGCQAIANIPVTVLQAPTANAGQDTTLPCSNNGVQIGQQPYSGVNYSWFPTLGLSNPTISNPNANTNYSINYILTATSTNGCTASDNVNITVLGGPNANAWGDTTICLGSTVDIHVSGADSYLWSTGDTTTTISVNPAQTTQFFVVSTLNGCADFDTVTVTLSIPKPNLGKDTTICANLSYLLTPGIFTSYAWSTGQSSPLIYVDSVGYGLGDATISVEVMDAIGCSASDTVVITFDDCTGLLNVDNEEIAFSIFPNPSKGNFRLTSTNSSLKSLELAITDLDGKIVYSQELRNVDGTFNRNLDLTKLPKGIYLVRLISGESVETLKIIIQ